MSDENSTIKPTDMLQYIKFWDMVKRYDVDNELQHVFPAITNDDELIDKLFKASKIREYFENNPQAEKEKTQHLVDKYREYARCLLKSFAKYQGYQLRKIKDHEYKFRPIKPVLITDKPKVTHSYRERAYSRTKRLPLPRSRSQNNNSIYLSDKPNSHRRHRKPQDDDDDDDDHHDRNHYNYYDRNHHRKPQDDDDDHDHNYHNNYDRHRKPQDDDGDHDHNYDRHRKPQDDSDDDDHHHHNYHDRHRKPQHDDGDHDHNYDRHRKPPQT
jgi:hypothetical protein